MVGEYDYILDDESEKENRRLNIEPKLKESGWINEEKPWMVKEEIMVTPGPLSPFDDSGKRNKSKSKQPDYILFYDRTCLIAVVEAKESDDSHLEGLDQAIGYAEMLPPYCKFAYSTNGKEIEEWDLIKKKSTTLSRFPTPEELWARLNSEMQIPEDKEEFLFQQYNLQSTSPDGGKMEPRYYQESAINAALYDIASGKKKILLNLATGTGKTFIAFQIAWRLWQSEEKHPKILFITDRTKLQDQAYKKDFAPFENARHIIKGKMEDAYDMYFALYQAFGVDKEQGELYKLYPQNFFEYIIVDECHRGVSDEGKWRNILDYFKDAVHIGMTATPKLLTGENEGTYNYFGKPAYVYPLKQGIADGFLAPYFVERVVMTYDKTGYRPKKGEVDMKGKPLEDRIYTLNQFDMLPNGISIESRQEEVARDLVRFLKKKDINDKTILFCQNSTHAADMTKKIRNESGMGHEYCKRIVSLEHDHDLSLDRFCDPKTKNPVIAVTSRLMSTGIDAPTCKAIALDKMIGSMTEFKQIIGRGTRVSESFGKYWFTIIDYRGVTKLFEDPSWDGEPMAEKPKPGTKKPSKPGKRTIIKRVQGGTVIVEERIVRVVDMSTGKTRVLSFEQFTKENVLQICSELASDLQNIWINPKNRRHFISKLDEVGITLEHLREILENYDKDIFDLLLHISYDKDMKTRRQRIDNTTKKKFFLEQPENAQKVIKIIMEHYAEKGYKELELDQSLELFELEKFSEFGGLHGVVEIFKDKKNLDKTLSELIQTIYEVS